MAEPRVAAELFETEERRQDLTVRMLLGDALDNPLTEHAQCEVALAGRDRRQVADDPPPEVRPDRDEAERVTRSLDLGAGVDLGQEGDGLARHGDYPLPNVKERSTPAFTSASK